MIVRTAFAQDGEVAAAMTWRYPATAHHPFPSGAINGALGAIYRDPRESLDHPYLFIARDRYGVQCGLVITDPEGVALDQELINAIYTRVIDQRANRRGDFVMDDDVAALAWVFETEFVFPVDPINAILAGLYNHGASPYLYPVWDRMEEDEELVQIGLLISTPLELAGDPSENWRSIRERYRIILQDDNTHPTEVPWTVKEWSLA